MPTTACVVTTTLVDVALVVVLVDEDVVDVEEELVAVVVGVVWRFGLPWGLATAMGTTIAVAAIPTRMACCVFPIRA